MLSVASVLESLGQQVFFAWDNPAEITALATMLGIKLNPPQLDPAVKKLYFGNHPLAMYRATRPYDTIVYLSDGSVPLLGGKRNLLHMQVPFHGVGGSSFKNRLKAHFIHAVIVNSEFTKRVIDQEYRLNSEVIYPPVTPIEGAAQKENLILSVGRFEPSINAKHQDVLIQAFKTLSPRLPGWKLILAGASSSTKWVTQLQQSASGLPIEFVINASYADLCKLYAVSRIYWHAAGFGIDEVKNPELTEHFGISTVEALSAGCIPLVVPYGGQREIIPDQKYHWESLEELVAKTLEATKSGVLPQVDIGRYSTNNFSAHLQRLLT